MRPGSPIFYSLLTYVFRFLMWKLPGVHLQPAADCVAAWDHSLEQLDPTAYPNLVELGDYLVTSASTDQLEYGFEHLVSSLRTCVSGTSP